MQDQIGTIRIKTGETSVDLGGLESEKICDLRVYSSKKKADLSLLTAYPNVTELFLNGDFSNIDDISGLKKLRSLTMYLSTPMDFSGVHGMALQSLSASVPIDESFFHLFTDSVERLQLMSTRKITDLSFLEQATELKKLYLESLPAVEALPKFSKLKNLYALKIYELHRLNDIEHLVDSNIEYLSVSLMADKISGSRLADILIRMKALKQADMHLLDRSDNRYNVLKNRLVKEGKENLLTEVMDYKTWKKL